MDDQNKDMNEQQEKEQLVEHFFRREYAKMVSVITRYFGAGQVDLAEEIVQDALLEAIKSWNYHGTPENPTAWLYTVAKNKALNRMKKSKYQQKYENESKHSQTIATLNAPIDELFSDQSIADDQLRMMFVCCHPSISPDAQITLILKTLCGLSITEIAKAYMTSNEAINKRLVRARKKLKQNNIQFDLPKDDELDGRLDIVLEAIYLLFSEGYHATKGDALIRYELCLEAVRLITLIVHNRLFEDDAKANALLALMFFKHSEI